MGKKEHLIGEPVEAPKEKGLIRSFGHRDYLRSYLKRTLIAMVFAVLLILPMPFLFFSFVPGSGISWDLLIFSIVLLLIPTTIGISLGLTMGTRITRRMNESRIDLFEDHLTILARYGPTLPSLLLGISLDDIKRVDFNGEKVWREKKKRTAGWFKFFYRTPNPGVGDLFSMYSKPEDILTIELKRSILIERVMPPIKFENASFRSERVKKITLDILKKDHLKFSKELEYLGIGGGLNE